MSLYEALEQHTAGEPGPTTLQSFLTHCHRSPGDVFALFAEDPEGRLSYVCSSDGAFDSAGFPLEIDPWPDGSRSRSAEPHLLPHGYSPAGWLVGLPEHGALAWHLVETEPGNTGLLVLWQPDGPGLTDEVAEQFEQLERIVTPFLAIWQSLRRHRRRYQRLKALERLSLAVTSSLDLREVLVLTCDAVVGPLGFERAGIYVLDQARNVLRGTWGSRQDGAHEDLTDIEIPLSERQDSRVKAALGDVDYAISNPDPDRGPVSSRAPTAVIPLLARSQVLGVLQVDNGVSLKRIHLDHIHVLLPFAAHAAHALRNASVHEQLASHIQMAETMEQQRRSFEREVILSVTGGKLKLCEKPDIEAECGRLLMSTGLTSTTDVGRCRQLASRAAIGSGLSLERKSDFELCLGEAATNCFQHAGGGQVSLYRKDDRVQIRVCDNGPGITSFILPRATLFKGYSTKTSLGVGFSLMISLCDRLYLATSSHGTDMLIELRLEQPSEEDSLYEQLGLPTEGAD